jgi:hypothetical protein
MASFTEKCYKLRYLLAEQNWKQANQETKNIIFGIINETKEIPFYLQNISQISSRNLRLIDRLWLKYSQGKFGFSVQQKIYREIGGTQDYDSEKWAIFIDKVGWNESLENENNENNNITLENVPEGHFPMLIPQNDYTPFFFILIILSSPLLAFLVMQIFSNLSFFLTEFGIWGLLLWVILLILLNIIWIICCLHLQLRLSLYYVPKFNYICSQIMSSIFERLKSCNL